MSKGIGIFIGQNEVIAVSAIRSASGPQIKSFAIEPINREESEETGAGQEAPKSGGSNPEARAILKVLEKIKESGGHVIAAISSSQVVTRQFMMPAVPKKDEAGAVRFETSRYIPFKLTDSVLDYHVRSVHKNLVSVTVAAIRRETVATCLQNLHAASVKLLMLEPIYCAVSRVAAALNMTDKSKAQGFVALQSDGNVNVTLASKGIVYLSRDFLLTGEAEEDKKRFHEEIAASIDYFYKLTGGESVGHVFLTGPGNLRGWIEHLEHAFSYTVRFDVPNLPSAKNIPQETLNVIWVAFGLALRSLDYRSPLGDVKLLPKEHRRSGFREMLSHLLFQSLAIFALFLFARLFVFQPEISKMDRQHHDIVETINQQDSGSVLKAIPDLEAEKEALNARADQLMSILGRPVLFSSILTAIGRGLPSAIWLEDIAFGFKKDVEKDQPSKKKLKFSASGLCYSGSVDKETAIVSGWIKYLSAKQAIADHMDEIKVTEIRRQKVGNREMTRFQIVSE